MEGILISIEDIGKSDFPERTEELGKISDLGYFLFDKLQVKKTCLHFIIGRRMLNGDGKMEGSFNALDPVIFTELTGITAPEEFKSKTFEELKEWMEDTYSRDLKETL